MCIICIEIMNERMTLVEAQRALPELIWEAEDGSEEEEHLYDVYNGIIKKMIEEEKEDA